MLSAFSSATPAPSGTAAAASPSGTAAAATAPASLGNVTLDVDPAQSKLGFIGSKKTQSHPGEFTKFKASITLVDGKAEGGKISVEIDMNSIKTDQTKLDEHLKTDDFFDVKKHPTATFVSKEIRTGGAWENSHTIVGELTMHGVTKPIEFPATIKIEGDVVTGTADFAINRKDWKINYKGKIDDLIREDVLIQVRAQGPRQEGLSAAAKRRLEPPRTPRTPSPNHIFFLGVLGVLGGFLSPIERCTWLPLPPDIGRQPGLFGLSIDRGNLTLAVCASSASSEAPPSKIDGNPSDLLAPRLRPPPLHPRSRSLGRSARGVVARVVDREAPERALVAKVWRSGLFDEQALLGEFTLLLRARVPGLARAHDLARCARTGAAIVIEEHVELDPARRMHPRRGRRGGRWPGRLPGPARMQAGYPVARPARWAAARGSCWCSPTSRRRSPRSTTRASFTVI